MKTTIIAIANHKGGTGKTTTTVNLGCAMAKRGKKVFLIDFDPQGSLTFNLGINTFPHSLADVIINNIPLEDAIMEREGLSVLPTNMELADLELSLATYSERENVLKNVLSQAKGFDYILIDCSPSFNILTVNALNAAQKVIIPLQLEVLSLQGLELITQTIFKVKENLNDNLSILGVLPVMFDESREITSEIYDFLKNNYGFNIFKNKIYEDEKIIETPSFGSSIIAYAPESISASNYQKLAKEVIKKLKEKG